MAEGKLSNALLSLKTINKEINVLRNQIGNMKKQLESIPDEVEVTDHAIVQYLRRVMGINIDELVAKILNKEARTPPGALGDGEYGCAEGHRLVIKDNKVVTVK